MNERARRYEFLDPNTGKVRSHDGATYVNVASAVLEEAEQQLYPPVVIVRLSTVFVATRPRKWRLFVAKHDRDGNLVDYIEGGAR